MRGIGIGNYYLCYDENAVYHIEDGINRNVVKAFSCNSWDMAMQFAKAYLEEATMYRDKLVEIIHNGYAEWVNNGGNGNACDKVADYLIANGIGNITNMKENIDIIYKKYQKQKARADVAEEALELTIKEIARLNNNCACTGQCIETHSCMSVHKKYWIQQAEQRLEEKL
ncbi:hypothetical protein EOM82_07690 [bacterium]|nr:hypothetical protein [bacterium]